MDHLKPHSSSQT